jgi:hypothetical protein
VKCLRDEGKAYLFVFSGDAPVSAGPSESLTLDADLIFNPEVLAACAKQGNYLYWRNKEEWPEGVKLGAQERFSPLALNERTLTLCSRSRAGE